MERTQPILPICEKIPERQSHEYYRHGTTTLFAALAVATGKVSGSCEEHHTRKEFLKFLKKLNKESDRSKVLHVIIDNYATHKTKEVLKYGENSKGRIVLHFIPTHSSWLNLVERWFAEITSKRIRRESWASVQELEKGITTSLTIVNTRKVRGITTSLIIRKAHRPHSTQFPLTARKEYAPIYT